MIRLSLFLLACCLAAPPAGAQHSVATEGLPPVKAGVWIFYGGDTSFFMTRPSADGRGVGVTQGDGFHRAFAVRTEAPVDGKPVRGHFRFPGNVWSHRGPSPARDWSDADTIFNGDPESSLYLWSNLLAHHAPPQPFLFVNGAAEVAPDQKVETHQACGQRLISKIYDRVIATEESPEKAARLRLAQQRRASKQEADVDGLESLLSLLSVPLRPSSTDLSDLGTGLATKRLDEMRPHARVFSLTLDLLAASQVPPPAVCARMNPSGDGERLRDQCTMHAIIDLRDGWPFAAMATREIERADKSKSSTSLRMERLTPAEVTIPPNPCV